MADHAVADAASVGKTAAAGISGHFRGQVGWFLCAMSFEKLPEAGLPTHRVARQFGLSRLFALTSIAAVAAALVSAFGPGTLLTSGGILLAWLNRCGAFAGLQSGLRQRNVLLAAWVTFLASLALPSIRVFGLVAGAGAAWIALASPVVEAYRSIVAGEWIEAGLFVYFAIDIANVLMAALPVLAWRIERGGGQRYSAALAVTMVSAWRVSWESPLLIGYYVWCASFFVVLLAIRVNTWTLVGMNFTAAAIAVLPMK